MIVDDFCKLYSGWVCPTLGGPFYYTTLFTLYKSPEKKWHRSVKMDKNKCPFFKRAVGLCAKGPLKNAL